jgi:hypothetical protein
MSKVALPDIKGGSYTLKDKMVDTRPRASLCKWFVSKTHTDVYVCFMEAISETEAKVCYSWPDDDVASLDGASADIRTIFNLDNYVLISVSVPNDISFVMLEKMDDYYNN